MLDNELVGVVCWVSEIVRRESRSNSKLSAGEMVGVCPRVGRGTNGLRSELSGAPETKSISKMTE